MKNKITTILFLLICTCVTSQSLSKKFFDLGMANYEVHNYGKAKEYLVNSWNIRSEKRTTNYIIKTCIQLREYKEAWTWQQKIISSVHSEDEKKQLIQLLLINKKYHLLDKSLLELKEDIEKEWYLDVCLKLDSIHKWEKNQTSTVKNLKVINTNLSEISPVVLEGRLVFSSNRLRKWSVNKDLEPEEAIYDFYASEGEKLTFKKPELMSRLLSSHGHEISPCFSVDEQDIYFTRIGKEKNKSDKMKLYRSKKESEVWLKPKPFILNDSLDAFGQPFISRDGQWFFFVSDIEGGYGGSDIYIAKAIDDEHWSTPINLGPTINTAGNEMNPFFNENGELYFASDTHFGIGGYDLFVSSLEDGEWKIPENLKTPINSSADDLSIFWSDTTHAYISSNRIGGKGLEDIYYLSEK